MNKLIFFILLNIFSLSVLSANEPYPISELKLHSKLGSLDDLITNIENKNGSADRVLIERITLVIDLVEGGLDIHGLYLSALTTKSLRILTNLNSNDWPDVPHYQVKSLKFRINNLKKIYQSSSTATLGYTRNNMICNRFERVANSYCKPDGKYALIATTINGGSGIQERRIDLFLRNADFSQYKNNEELFSAIANAGIPQTDIQKFDDKFTIDVNNSLLLGVFNENAKILKTNPKFFVEEQLLKIKQPTTHQLKTYQDIKQQLDMSMRPNNFN
ncbi:hypothetical protein HWQ46_13835 [Shewanella sp. D64]|uniref:hypothetical protein n=1 Tax=unclassified Shewanella TaxID=196818 RepID=UPI0022BA4C97|nr:MULTISPECIES: hypothetical protein [unclassified Shewanella]MEC4726631.1 hypothetical protein [Shewanella sp. D64]MEC4739005.1 hypothetical protein [Shewanella sp. E94]WBJ96848.1 hypothetical protein HWQ47_06940 [Shewanella sp. MTB7]